MKRKWTKQAVITGASSDIGIAITRYLINQNYNCTLVTKNKKFINSVEEKFQSNRVKVFPIDLACTNKVKEKGRQLASSLSAVDILIHVAGVYHDDSKAFYNLDFSDHKITEVSNILNVGFLSFVYLTYSLLPIFENNGRIIAISGTFSSAKGWLPYYTSKKSLEIFITGLADELQSKNITANCISPGDTITKAYQKFFPEYANAQYAISPADIVDTLSFILSERSQYISGQVITIKK